MPGTPDPRRLCAHGFPLSAREESRADGVWVLPRPDPKCARCVTSPPLAWKKPVPEPAPVARVDEAMQEAANAEAYAHDGTFDHVRGTMHRVFNECDALRAAGQKEYARRPNAAFANFERVAERTGVSRETALLVYLEKHMDGIHAHVEGHRSQRESVNGRINDAIVYLTILRAMFEEDAARNKGQ